MFKSYTDVRDWLENFIPYTYSKKNLGLERINYLLALLGNPQEKFKSIHVAGTSGKGSTAFYIARLLQLAGPVAKSTPTSSVSFRIDGNSFVSGTPFCATRESQRRKAKGERLKVGLHISPHLVYIGERMQISGHQISVNQLVKLVNEISSIVEEIKSRQPQLTPSYFEILVAASFLYFAKEKVDFAVVEVGLGGRLDATNVLKPEVSVITNVGLDHTDILGKTIEKIAFEKAGIIKPRIPIVTAAGGNALKIIEKVAKEKKAKLVTINTPLGVRPPKFDIKDYLTIYRDILKDGGDFVTRDVFLLSINSLLSLGIYPTRSQIIEAFSSSFPARFEEIAPNVIIDGAHNLEKIKALVNFLKNSKLETRNSKLTLVVAFKKGKDWKKMVEYLVKNLDIERCYTTQFYSVTDTGPPPRKATEGQVLFAAVEPEEIKKFIISNFRFDSKLAQCEQFPMSRRRQGFGGQANVKCFDNSQEAVFEALQSTVNGQMSTVLITGSLYLAGEARTLWHLPAFA